MHFYDIPGLHPDTSLGKQLIKIPTCDSNSSARNFRWRMKGSLYVAKLVWDSDVDVKRAQGKSCKESEVRLDHWPPAEGPKSRGTRK